MKVFISWSGERSRRIAEQLYRWLPAVLQAVKPYYSPDDVTKGARWAGEIAKELEISRVGILVVTPDNMDASWLMFEAGALSKNMDSSRVCPLLFGVEPTDITGPLVQFQAARFEYEDVKRVVRMINAELPDSPLVPEVFDEVFDMWWPRLQQGVQAELATAPESAEAVRPDREMLEEVLTLVRSFHAESRLQRVPFHPRALDDLISGFGELVRTLQGRSDVDPIIWDAIARLERPVRHVARAARNQTVHLVEEFEKQGFLVRANPWSPLDKDPD